MPAPLSPKAILEGRSSNRAPVMLIIGLLVSALCLLLAMGFYLLQKGVIPTAIGLFLAIPTAVVLIALVLLIDRLEPEPPLNMLLAFGWGAGVSVVAALFLNTFIGVQLRQELDGGWGMIVTASVVAPIVEESLKGSLLLIILLLRRHEIDGPTDGIVYAALPAIGFALVENILYYARGVLSISDDLWFMVVVRGILAPLGHPIYTSMIGLGVAYAATRRGAGGFLAVVGGWIAAVLLHGLWNASGYIAARNGIYPLVGTGLAWVFLLFVLIGLVVVVIRDRRRIVRLIRTHLPAYVQSGIVQPHDVRMLGTMSGRRRARKWARSSAGIRGAQAMGDYQLAATELALLHKHASNRSMTADTFHARRESILFLMRSARDAFFRRVPQAPPAPWVGNEQSGFFSPPGVVGQLPQHRPQPPVQRPGPVRPHGGGQRPGAPPQPPPPGAPPPAGPPAGRTPPGPPGPPPR